MQGPPIGCHFRQKSKFQKEHRVLMRKRTKLNRIILRMPQIISQLLSIEEQISSSHLKEKIHEEHVAVSKIKVDPKHFFRYAKRYSICKQEVGPLLNPLNNTLTDNKYEMCCLLVNQFNSVFTKPKQTSVIKDPVTFFLSHTTREDDLFLTDITLSDSIIIGAALCKNAWWHQPTSSCSEWSVPGYCPWPFTIFNYDY